MKKSLLVIMLAFFAISTSAQNKVEGSLPSWWKGSKVSQEKPQVDTVQSGTKMVETQNNEDFLNLVVNAVSPSLNIVKQQYRLKKDEDFFGKNNMNHFGESISLGVKVAGGMLLQHSVMYPWINDRDYYEVNAADIYSPVLYMSFVKPVIGGEYESVDMELDSPYVKMVGRDSLLYMHYDTLRDFGLYMDTAEGEKNGYLLWVEQDEEIINYRVERMSVDALLEKTLVPLGTSDSSSVLGGIFVIPFYEHPGTISFHLAGVVSTMNGHEWKLKMLTKNDAIVNIID